MLPYWAPSGKALITLELGITAETVRMALPSTFDGSQQLLISQTVEPIRSLGIDPVRMTMADQIGGRRLDAVADIKDWMSTTPGNNVFNKEETFANI